VPQAAKRPVLKAQRLLVQQVQQVQPEQPLAQRQLALRLGMPHEAF
jgi:hypothetical protein